MAAARDGRAAINAYVRGTLWLCALFFVCGMGGAFLGVRLGLPAKRVAMVAIGAASLLLAVQPPSWLADWRSALGPWRARAVLLLTAAIAFFLGIAAPLSWLRALAG